MSRLRCGHRGVPEAIAERSLVWLFLPPRRGVPDNRTCCSTLQGVNSASWVQGDPAEIMPGCASDSWIQLTSPRNPTGPEAQVLNCFCSLNSGLLWSWDADWTSDCFNLWDTELILIKILTSSLKKGKDWGSCDCCSESGNGGIWQQCMSLYSYWNWSNDICNCL